MTEVILLGGSAEERSETEKRISDGKWKPLPMPADFVNGYFSTNTFDQYMALFPDTPNLAQYSYVMIKEMLDAFKLYHAVDRAGGTLGHAWEKNSPRVVRANSGRT